jgi:predicted dehydrogenase
MVKVGVIGVGALGRHHARIYAALPGVELVGVCDVREEAAAIAREYGVAFFSDFRALAERIEAASVATPTVSHCRIACALLAEGKSVLVEKPIAPTLAEADRMIAVADQTGARLQVGHLERFNPAVRAARRIVRQPRFFEVDRLSVFTERSLDIDVVTDLMVHDLDILSWFVGAPVASVRAVGIPILSPKVDIANARIEFQDGCVANLTASRVSAEKVRKMRFFHAGGYVSVDYAAQQAVALELLPAASPTVRPSIAGRPLEVEKDEPLRAQLASFIASVAGRTQPEVDGRTGRMALELALSVTEEIKRHAERTNLSPPTLR